jgi:tRNA G46 methylase TrmB
MISYDKTGANITEYGDYQTPPAFTQEVCQKIKEFYKADPKAIIEPTFGAGNFFDSIADAFPNANSIFGIESPE